MYLPSIQTPISNDVYISGDVKIDSTVVLGPGVILQAAPESQIVLGAGVCLGMGTIINAYQQGIELEAGVVLGAGVLIIGQGKIGNNACIGAATTIYNASVEARALIPAGSLIGDSSRQNPPLESSPPSAERQKPEIQEETTSTKPSQQAQDLVEPEEISVESSPTESQTPQPQKEKQNGSVIGQVYVNQLLVTLFPENKNWQKNPPSNNLS
jgi:carbon dioxide concentrating mechanism protein CcmN